MAKRKYTILNTGVLTLVFIFWLLGTSVLAGVVLFLLAGIGRVHIDTYAYYLILGVSELLLIAPLIVYMAITKTRVSALMGNRTSARQNLLAALVGVLLAPALTGLSALIQWLFTLAGAHSLSTSVAMNPATVGELMMGMLCIGLFAGAVEEPVFRGAVLRGVGSAAGRRAAVVITALVFSFVHMDAVGLIQRFLIGLVLGYMAWRAGAVLPGVFAHAAYNSTLLAMGLVLSRWNGFMLLPGASPDVNGMLTMVLISIPFAAAAFGAYRFFARATPESAAWSVKPYAAGEAKAKHYIPWIVAGAILLLITAAVMVIMFLPPDILRNISPYFR